MLNNSYTIQNTGKGKLVPSREDFLPQPKTSAAWMGCEAQPCELTMLTALVYADLSQLNKWDVIPGRHFQKKPSDSCYLANCSVETGAKWAGRAPFFSYLLNRSTQKRGLPRTVSSESWKAMKTPQSLPQRDATGSHLMWQARQPCRKPDLKWRIA